MLYPAFSGLPFESVNCRRKTVKTYLNSGAAGCVYTAAEYRWSGKKLEPVRVEKQDLNGESMEDFKRTIETWPNGRRKLQTKIVPANDCHR